MGAIARIIARYGIGALAGYLAAKGLPVDGLANDPEVVALIEMGITGFLTVVPAYIVERFYVLAKKRGWAL
ncbi:MAG: hypothetical protein KF849_18530 [Rhizobiaceae bacterium]|nr:hypothetical protein [Rhizobiaceae bacterium]